MDEVFNLCYNNHWILEGQLPYAGSFLLPASGMSDTHYHKIFQGGKEQWQER